MCVSLSSKDFSVGLGFIVCTTCQSLTTIPCFRSAARIASQDSYRALCRSHDDPAVFSSTATRRRTADMTPLSRTTANVANASCACHECQNGAADSGHDQHNALFNKRHKARCDCEIVIPRSVVVNQREEGFLRKARTNGVEVITEEGRRSKHRGREATRGGCIHLVNLRFVVGIMSVCVKTPT